MKPILFKTDMVRAILEGCKTVTRRVVKEPWFIEDEGMTRVSGYAMHRGYDYTHGMPYPDSIYHLGDILYVRETWNRLLGEWIYKADQKPGFKNLGKWCPSIHMPRAAARIFLRVTGVSVERLQDITEEQSEAEGVERQGVEVINAADVFEFKIPGTREVCTSARGAFSHLWNSTIKPADRALYGWEANPWVWVIEFERCGKPEGGT